MKKTNLGIYNQMKSFSENMKYEQKLDLRLTENMMVMENIKIKLDDIECKVNDQNNDQKDLTMIKEIEELKESMAEYVLNKDYEILKEEFNSLVNIDHLEHCNDQIKQNKKNVDEKIDDINKKLEEEYINAEDLNKFSENLQKTLEDYVYQQTPRIQSIDADKITFDLKELHKQNKMLYEKFDLMKDKFDNKIKDQLELMKEQFDNKIKELEAKLNEKPYIDSLRTAYDIEEDDKKIVTKPLLVKKSVPNLKFNRK